MMEYEEERDEGEEEEEEMDFQTNTNFKLADTKPATLATAATPRYRECLKNHAVAIGGHAVDGCGEFMPAGPDGTIESFKCAACSCHRNFHRKELISYHHPHPHHHLSVYNPRPQFQAQFYPYNRTATSPSGFLQPRPLALASQARCGGDDGGGSSVGRKRIRTKFTTEQKEKMVELAEKLGWKIQKQDEDVVHQFCQQMGLKRNVLKVWLHNNKHTLGKKP